MPILVLLAVVIPLGVNTLQNADAERLTNSTNPIEAVFGKLVSGVNNVRSGGDQGQNLRFKNTTTVLTRRVRTGGAGRATAWGRPTCTSPPITPEIDGAQPNSFPVWLWFSFGGGAAIAW